MRILIALTYYRPHVSGVSIYAERLARALVRRGHAVTVLTSQTHAGLPARERHDGVDVVRVPVWRKVSKGAIMPRFPAYAAALVRRHDAVNIHLPQFEASLLAALARRHGKTAVLTYHCDLKLPAGSFNRAVELSLRPLNHLAALLSHRVVTTTRDYAESSPFLRRYLPKLAAIVPVIEAQPADAAITRRLAARWSFGGRPTIGFAARFAAEKGVEFLLRALPMVLEHVPHARVAFTGAYKDTIGEDEYWQRLQPLLERHAEHLTFLDLLRPEEMPCFFSLCDVVALTSLNSTEAFGMVQVEAMLAGTPVVATNLPGVRQPVLRTGMGEIVAARDPQALAAALVRVMQRRNEYFRPREHIAAAFDADQAVRQYEDLFADAVVHAQAGTDVKAAVGAQR